MAVEQIAIVWNPSKTTKEDLDAALTAALEGVAEPPSVSWFETSEEDPGQSAAESALAAGADVVVAAGGDGTVRAVGEHLARAEADAALAIVPLGTGNLLARNLDVPLRDPAAALRRAVDAEGERAIDAAWAEIEGPVGSARYAFFVMAGFGIDAHMITETDDGLKEKAGWLAYVESLGRAVSASGVIDMRLSYDGGAPVEERAHTLIVGNCGTLQGGIALLPDADPADGELDLLLLSADGIGGWLDTMRSMVWDNGLRRILSGGSASSSESVAHSRVRELSATLREARIVEIDGEEIGEASSLTISVQPGALRVR